MQSDEIRQVVREAVGDVLGELLQAHLERLSEVLLEQIGGLSDDIVGLRAGLAQPSSGGAGAAGDLSELILAATARGGRFL
ncbi:MAG: hypothetical protein AAGF20_04720 [Pseudomonadota bacterium]